MLKTCAQNCTSFYLDRFFDTSNASEKQVKQSSDCRKLAEQTHHLHQTLIKHQSWCPSRVWEGGVMNLHVIINADDG